MVNIINKQDNSSPTSPTFNTTSEGNEEPKDSTSKHILSKFEYDLYTESDNIIYPVIRVKHIIMPNKGERWKIFKDNKLFMTIDGSKISKKDRDFFKTFDGINWLLTKYKNGIKSFNQLKKELKLIKDI